MDTVVHLATKSAVQITETKFPFLKLPAELRLHIYELNLGRDVKVGTFRIPGRDQSTLSKERGTSTILGLLGVSKQVRQEARAVLAGSTNFLYHVIVESSYKRNFKRLYLPVPFLEVFSRRFSYIPIEDLRNVDLLVDYHDYPAHTVTFRMQLHLIWTAKDGKGKADVGVKEHSDYMGRMNPGDTLTIHQDFDSSRHNLIVKSIPYAVIPDLVRRQMEIAVGGQTEECTLPELLNAAADFVESFQCICNGLSL
ncbi:MAG: hypothetical protein M1821_003454 [Bathelium mastoideum]|nr:MAG: hypothetical protein M1821_003454 [Bathelium mastoideum]